METLMAPTASAGTERDAVILDGKYKSDWDKFVQQASGVIAWHGYDWCKLLKKHHDTDFYPIAVYNGSQISGILPLYRVRLWRGPALISVPYFVAGGVAAEETWVQEALVKKAIDLSRQLQIGTITFKQYKTKLSGPLLSDDNYYNRELTLSDDIDDIWRQISAENQARIEESDRHATDFIYPSSDVSSFYRLLLHDQHAEGVPCVGARWIEDLYKTGMYEIALLRYRGTVVAGTMVKKFRDTVSFPFTCVQNHSEQSELFAYALYWRLISRLAREGIRIMHSGRIPNTDATFRYRLGWGGTKYPYYYQYVGMGEGKTEFSTKRGRKRELVGSLWRRTPMTIAKAIGPIVVRQFP